jgi:hypothetical protein
MSSVHVMVYGPQLQAEAFRNPDELLREVPYAAQVRLGIVRVLLMSETDQTCTGNCTCNPR